MSTSDELLAQLPRSGVAASPPKLSSPSKPPRPVNPERSGSETQPEEEARSEAAAAKQNATVTPHPKLLLVSHLGKCTTARERRIVADGGSVFR